MPKFYVIDEWCSEYPSKEEAVEAARQIGATGVVVKAVAFVEFVNPAPVFTVRELED